MVQGRELVLLAWSALYCASLLGLATAFTADSDCPDGLGQEIITKNTALLSPDNIVSSSAIVIYPDQNLVNFDFSATQVWCTEESTEVHPTFNLTFTQPVVVTGILSGGYNYGSGNAEFVTRFSFQYSSSVAPGDLLEFEVPTINLFLPFSPPIVVKSVYMVVLEYHVYISDICWTLAFFGCPLPQASSVPASGSMTALITTSSVAGGQMTSISGSIPSSSLPSPTQPSPAQPTPSQCQMAGGGSEQRATDDTRVEKDYMVVAIVLPIAILTIVLVGAIVAVGVFLCIRNGSKWSPAVQYTRQRADTDVTVKVLDNHELYQPGIIVQTDGGQDASTADGTAYEPLAQDVTSPGETADNTYESLSPQTGNTAEGDEDMFTNPMYGASGEHDEYAIQMKANESYHGNVPGTDEGTNEYAYPTVPMPGPPVHAFTANQYEETH